MESEIAPGVSAPGDETTAEPVQDETASVSDQRTTHYNVSCQTCRTSKTFVTLQGVNMFFLDHDGHTVVEGKLFDRALLAKTPAPEPAKPAVEALAPVVAATQELVVQQMVMPQEEGAPEQAVESPEPDPVEEPLRLDEVHAEVAATPAAGPLLNEIDRDEPLLLARSSYIGDSDEKRADAQRVSRALKEFKWNVEPPFVIGVMVDDTLSVETNVGVVSASMVERVEELGYKLVAVNSPRGSPVAWFKQRSADSPWGDADATVHTPQGTRTYDKDRAVWEESFVSLLTAVKDVDADRLRRLTEALRSQGPPADVQP